MELFLDKSCKLLQCYVHIRGRLVILTLLSLCFNLRLEACVTRYTFPCSLCNISSLQLISQAFWACGHCQSRSRLYVLQRSQRFFETIASFSPRLKRVTCLMQLAMDFFFQRCETSWKKISSCNTSFMFIWHASCKSPGLQLNLP